MIQHLSILITLWRPLPDDDELSLRSLGMTAKTQMRATGQGVFPYRRNGPVDVTGPYASALPIDNGHKALGVVTRAWPFARVPLLTTAPRSGLTNPRGAAKLPDCPASFNTPFALGASVLYVELVQIRSADNSSFRLYGLYDTPLDTARAQTEDRRKKFVQSPNFR
jgi:hypothetical protein